MSRKRIRLNLAKNDPWLNINRGGPGHGGDDEVSRLVVLVVAVVILYLLFS